MALHPSPTRESRTRQGNSLRSQTIRFVPIFIAWVTGIVIGFVLRTTSSASTSTDGIMYTPKSFNQIIPSEDGWKSIDVFYGSTDHVVSLLPKEQKWFGQVKQDEAIFALLGQKRNGFFVDLAANDATTLSNTYILERDFGWKGLCIEPNPMYWYNLSHFRPNCQLVAAIVGQKRMEQVHFRYQAGEHGGISGEDFDNGPKWKKESVQEYTIPLLDIFRRYAVPDDIDYLSLDVEGAEEFIMKSFPLERYKIRLLTVERPKVSLRKLLESHGYEQIQRMSRWGETLWTRKEFHSELDISRLEDFHAKKQYLVERALRHAQHMDAMP